ncbi:MAG: flagellar transcriptional regulator FlhD [Rhodocyclaceae bacterium]|uniref:Flagellar transcriptional regulator FlhD n=1 Tax=Sphingomonas sp. A1 TaxID=90322 RepID=A0A0A8K8K4_9SPHN|nr:flagellar transcriptional regulator FlhD [Sphingomonas sp. A1]
MKATDVQSEIKELNLAYLMLAQQMIKTSRESAMLKLGVGSDVADIIEGLTPGQILRMAGSDMMLCRFRFDDGLLVNLLANHERDSAASRIHAAILAAGRPVEQVA